MPRKTNRPLLHFTIEPGDEVHLTKLPQKYADALSAVSDHGYGLKYDAAAAHLNVSLGTVKSRVSRAKDMIRVMRAQALVDAGKATP